MCFAKKKKKVQSFNKQLKKIRMSRLHRKLYPIGNHFERISINMMMPKTCEGKNVPKMIHYKI